MRKGSPRDLEQRFLTVNAPLQQKPPIKFSTPAQISLYDKYPQVMHGNLFWPKNVMADCEAAKQ